jgi:ABC-type phosphate transport system substrate-binding protein
MLRKVFTAICLLAISSVAAAELVVVVNPANGNSLDAKQIQRIFLGKGQSLYLQAKAFRRKKSQATQK